MNIYPRYESIQTETNPSEKQGGQMGQPETETPSSMKTTANMASGTQSSGDPDKMEQKVASSGVGGQTSTSGGTGGADEGYGSVKNQTGFEGTSAENSRTTEGYGGDQDMDKTIGG